MTKKLKNITFEIDVAVSKKITTELEKKFSLSIEDIIDTALFLKSLLHKDIMKAMKNMVMYSIG